MPAAGSAKLQVPERASHSRQPSRTDGGMHKALLSLACSCHGRQDACSWDLERAIAFFLDNPPGAGGGGGNAGGVRFADEDHEAADGVPAGVGVGPEPWRGAAAADADEDFRRALAASLGADAPGEMGLQASVWPRSQRARFCSCRSGTGPLSHGQQQRQRSRTQNRYERAT
jgi:hypothetical protein